MMGNGGIDMTKDDRLAYILAALEQNRSVQIARLAEQMRVSSVTVRSDLRELEATGKLRRTHGGAVCPGEEPSGFPPVEALLKPRNIANLPLKEALADRVEQMIAPGDSIFLGGGTTFYVIATRLKQRKDLSVVTSSMSVAFELAPFIDNIFLIGGELTECDGIYYTGGPKVEQELEKIYVNKAFFGVSGIDLNARLTLYDLSQFTLFTAMKKIAREAIIVSDSTKFGFQSAHRIGQMSNVADMILTNRDVDPRYLEALHQMNIPTILA